MWKSEEFHLLIHNPKTNGKQYSKIPLLVAANLEAGGNGIVKEGTPFGKPMQVAATADVEFARRLGEVCGVEGSAVGANWSFAPIIDIDYNWRNPITNVRTFGSDVDTVRQMGAAYVKEIQKHGVAAAIKHFPGDGCDERDQHVSVSVNSLSCEEWDKSYGAVYSECIEAGAKTVMVGHILQPAYTR
ncbi:MAG: glycoside hydrolase family 3 protein, partial [Clostridia bacterium]|nr:glycoside hydrolase family 3 protein [Clostridia bacterium]